MNIPINDMNILRRYDITHHLLQLMPVIRDDCRNGVAWKTAASQYPRVDNVISQVASTFMEHRSTVLSILSDLVGAGGCDWSATPVQPVLATALTNCSNTSCGSKLKMSARKVTVLTMTGATAGTVIVGRCRNSDCTRTEYTVDSWIEKSDGHVNKCYLPQTKVIQLSQEYFIERECAVVWTHVLPVTLCCKFWTLQQAYLAAFSSKEHPLQSPSENQLFKKAFILLMLLRHHINIKHPGPMRVSYSSMDTKAEELRPAMAAHTEWFVAHGATKWRHKCDECHPVDPTGRTASAVVVDGKRMGAFTSLRDCKLITMTPPGYQVCRVMHCMNDIVSKTDGVCEEHLPASLRCCVTGCHRLKTEDRSTCESVPCLERFIDFKKRLREAPRKELLSLAFSSQRSFGTQVSVLHDELIETAAASAGLNIRPGRRFLPGWLTTGWSCGVIVDTHEMHTYESTREMALLLSSTFHRLQEYPTYVFLDKACRFLPSLTKYAEENHEPGSPVWKLAENSVWLVDKFHFRSHNDAECTRNFNPNIVDRYTPGLQFNQSVAEQTNSWLDKISHIVRNVDRVTSRFYMYCFVDIRNEIVMAKRLQWNDDDEVELEHSLNK